MHAFLIVGKTESNRREKAKRLLEKYNTTENTTLEPVNNAHTISSIRELSRSLTLKSPKTRGVTVYEADKLTQDAANAFLKTLEEPPGDTIIILTAPTRDSVLETIASRCETINLGSTQTSLTDEEKEKHKKLLEKLIQGSVGERFKFGETAEDREKALLFIIGQIYASRERLLEDPKNSKWIKLVEALIQTKKDLEQNINVKLTLTNLFLNYS